MTVSRFYLKLSEKAVLAAGDRLTLAAAVFLTAVWSFAGAVFGLPLGWFLLTNMFGTMTALFVLLIMQHSQNRDMHALQVKTDELIRASSARNHLIGAERLEEEDLQRLVRDR